MAVLTLTTSAIDTTINQDIPTVPDHTDHEQMLYRVGFHRRTLLQFDLTGLPANALVSKVEMKLWFALTYPVGAVDVFRVLKAWDENATWNSPWTTPGCENTTSDRSSVVMGTAIPAIDWVTFNLDVTQFKLMQASNYGMLLQRTVAGEADSLITIHGRSETWNNPQLIITYTLPSGPPSENEIETESYKKKSYGLRYQVEHYNTDGIRIGTYQAFNSLSYVKTRNTVGSMIMVMPYKLGVEAEFKVGQLLEIWREMDGLLELQNETAYVIRSIKLYSDRDGRNLLDVTATDGLDLLSGAIVDYKAESVQASKEGFADDLIKQIVIENLGTSALVERRLPRFTVQPKTSSSVSIKKDFAWRNVLDVCTEIADSATELGTHTSFDVVRTDPATFELRTYIGQRGLNHGSTSGDILRAGVVYGNLREAFYEEQYADSYNAITAGGQGEEANRIISRKKDANRIANGSPYNRRELFVDARDMETAASVANEANAALLENRPKKIMGGKLENNRGMKWNRDFHFGDVLAVEAFGKNMDCHIESARVVVDSKQNEQVNIYLRGESDI